MDEKVTVLIPIHKPGEYLRLALESVFYQTYQKWKVILIDDVSGDSNLTQISDLIDDPRVDLIKNEKSPGAAGSLNVGLNEVKTPYVLLLNSDDYFPSRALQILLGEIERLPDDVALVYGNMRVVGEDVYEGDGSFSQNFIRTGRDFEDKYDFLLSNSSIWPRFYRTNCVLGVGGWPTDDPFEGWYLTDRMLYQLLERYRIHWIDELLYVRRCIGDSYSPDKSIHSSLFEWNIRNILKSWNDELEPIFDVDAEGWKYLAGLTGKERKIHSYEDLIYTEEVSSDVEKITVSGGYASAWIADYLQNKPYRGRKQQTMLRKKKRRQWYRSGPTS